jgi:hypothetical protein
VCGAFGGIRHLVACLLQAAHGLTWVVLLLRPAGQRVPPGIHPGPVQRVPGSCSRLHGPPGAPDPRQERTGQARLAGGAWGP